MHRNRWSSRIAVLLALAVLVAVAPGTELLAADRSDTAGTPIDVNRATAKELTAVPGIGETLAKRIVAFRDEHGPFRRVEDLMKVKGIGEKSLQKLRPHVRVTATG